MRTNPQLAPCNSHLAVAADTDFNVYETAYEAFTQAEVPSLHIPRMYARTIVEHYARILWA